MKESNKKRIIIRYMLIIGGLLLFSAVILFSLVRNTVVYASAWNEKANKVWGDSTVILPERGQILADDGTVLAANLYFYIPRIDWNFKGISDTLFNNNIVALSDSMSKFDDSRSAKEWEKELRRAYAQKKSNYRLINRLITHHEYKRLCTFPFLKESTKILYNERCMRRFKPFGSMAARSIGNVSDPQKKVHIYVNWSDAGVTEADFKQALPRLCDSLNTIFKKTSVEEWNQRLSEGFQQKFKSAPLTSVPVGTDVLKRIKKFPLFSKHDKMICDSTVKDTVIGRHGTSGLERALDEQLYGTAARAPRVALNANSTYWGAKPIAGYNITTTINIQLQDIVEEELYKMLHEHGGKWGTAILMETATGAIKAISNLDWNERAQDYIEGENHAVLGYEPGSVVKPISMLVALEDGLVKNIDAPVPTGAVWTFDGGVVKESHGGAASLTPRQIIAYSSNVGMSRIIYSKYASNPDGFRQRLEELGFFENFHTGIAGERQPRFLTLGRKPRDRVALTREAFGYTTEIPPMHTLAFFNAMANDGKFVRPRLIQKLSRPNTPDSIVPVSYVRQQVCSPENARKMREMLHGVVWDKGGTARVLQDSLVHIAGKTGTAYILENGHYSTGRKRLAFCGFFPYEKPKYSCMVLIWGADCGAARCSGTVLKNVALKMYARGMLDNESDYTSGNKNANHTVVMSYYNDRSRYETLRNRIVVGNTKHLPGNKGDSKNTIPNLKGSNAREAVARLEKMGLSVTCKGGGFVVAQTIAPGTIAQRGSKITLHLSNHRK